MQAQRIEVEIKKLRRQDYDRALDIARRSFMAHVGAGLTEEGQQSFLRYAEKRAFLLRQAAGHESYGAFQGGEMVGMMEIRRRSHLSMLFVEPELVGRGVGGALLRHCIRLCSPKLLPRALTLNASPYAMGFYRHLGFSETGPANCEGGLTSTPMQLMLKGRI